MEAALDPEDLPRQTEALRRIARELLRDEAAGDDAVQTAYLTALERPPSRLTPAWLRRVVRSRALDALRRERVRRERRLDGLGDAEPASEDGAGDFAERLELHRTLVGAVQELPETYQRALYLRYFEGLPPASIATRLGVPTKTVKTRLNRGLARLRARLGERYGRDGWRGVVAAAFPAHGEGGALTFAGTVTWTGGVLMAKKAMLALGILAAVWGAARWAADRGEPARPEVAARPPVAVRSEPVEPATAPATTTLSETAAREPVRTAAAPMVAEPRDDADEASLTVLARWPDGAPAAGVAVDLRRQLADLPERGVARASADAAGTVRFDGLLPGTYRVSADRRTWSSDALVELAPGEAREFELALPAGLTVEGVVVDGVGTPVRRAEIWLSTAFDDWMGGGAVAEVDADGRFRVEHVPSGRALGAIAPGFAPSPLHVLDERSPGPVRLELVLPRRGGDLFGTVFGPDGSPLAGAVVSAGAPGARPQSYGARFAPWPARTARADAEGRYALYGLAEGELEVEARADGLALARATAEIAVGRGARLDFTLVAGLSVAGVVSDSTGQPLADAIVRAFDREIERHFIPLGQYDHRGAFGYPAARTDERGAYRLDGVPPGEVRLFANPPPQPEHLRRRSEMRAESVMAGASGDVLTWNPTLTEGRVIEGVVTYRDGYPMPEVFVSAREPGTGESLTTRCDVEGRFRFLNLTHGPHALGVQLWDAPAGAAPVEATGVFPDGGLVRLAADYDRPAVGEPGSVRCTVVDAAGRVSSPELLEVELTTGRSSLVSPDRKGDAFVFRRVEPGRYRAMVVYDDAPIFAGDWFELAPREDRDLGQLTLGPAGALRLSAPRVDATAEADLLVFVRMAGLPAARSVELGVRAEALVRNLTPGEYQVDAYGVGVVSQHLRAVVREGDEAEVALEVVPAVARPIELVWPENAALGGLSLRVEDAGGNEVWERSDIGATSLTRPYVRRPQLGLGSYFVTAESQTGLRGTAKLDVLSLDPDQPTVRVELE